MNSPTPPPEKPPIFVTQVEFKAAKCGNRPEDCEDVYALNPECGFAVIADGASSGIFCRDWANILAQQFITAPPTLDNRMDWSPWLKECKDKWQRMMLSRTMRPLQIRKVQSTGAASTLIAVHLNGLAANKRGDCLWRAWAIGDSCFFLIRNNRLGLSFPYTDVEQFSRSPTLVRTLDTTVLSPQTRTGKYREGDILLLTTDALGKWLLQRAKECQRSWADVAAWSLSDWQDEIAKAMQARNLIPDDLTVVVLRAIKPVR